MSSISFKKANREQKKWRILLRGTSGSGKTTSALVLADQLKGDKRIAFVDTEKLSSTHNADKFDYDVLDFSEVSKASKYPGHHPKNYIGLVNLAESNDYGVLIIDSFSHVWMGEGGILQIVDNLASTKYQSRSGKDNTWAAWRDGNALYQSLIDKILMQNNIHIILTARAKQAYELNNGKVVRKGMDIQQRDGLEYEFDVVLNFESSKPGMAFPDKDRTGLFSNEGELVTEKTGQRLLEYMT